MNLETLFSTIDNLSPDDLEQLKKHLAQQEVRQYTAEQAFSDLDAAIDEFWGDSSEDEMQAIFEAMRTKIRF